MNNNFFEALKRNPIIASVRTEEEVDRAIKSKAEAVFIIHIDMNHLIEQVRKIKKAGKLVFIHVDLIPEDYTAEGLLRSFKDIDIKGKKIGIPRTYSARNVLPDTLEKWGANVILAESYRSILPHDISKIQDLINKIFNNEIDAITFTSPLTVKNLFKVAENKKDDLAKILSNNVLTVSIGPITGYTLDDFNVKYIYPERYTVKDMVDLMFNHIFNY